MRPDFNNKQYYPFEITDKNGVVRSGYFNEKAWNKTIENDILWEFIPDNGRVIEKQIESGKPDMSKAEMKGDKVIIPLAAENVASTDNNIDNNEVLALLEKVIQQRKAEMPENSYTTHLFQKGEEKILKKMGEECIEVILAKDKEEDIIYESADLIYHLMVYLVYKNIPFNKVLEELKGRHK